MTPIPKEDALEACKKCPRKDSGSCICADIEGSKGDIHNPPECLIFQFKQISEREHPHPIVSDGTPRIENKETDKLLLIKEQWAAQVVQSWKDIHEPNFIGNTGESKTVHKNTQNSTQDNQQQEAKTVHKSTKKAKETPKNSTLLPSVSEPKEPKITRSEKAIIRLIEDGITTPQKLAVARKCEVNIIYRHLRNLRKKGVINQFNEIVHFPDRACVSGAGKKEVKPEQPSVEDGAGKEKVQAEIPPPTDSAPRHQYRMHAHIFHIRIIERHQEFYKKLIGTTTYIDGNTVQYYSDTIVVRGAQSFIADDPFKCLVKGIDYFDRIFLKIEHNARVVIVKERSTAIQLKFYKLGEMGNEIAKDSERNGDQIHIYAREDGKLWLMTDDSWLFNEIHCLHPETGKDDFTKVMKQINDWRDKDPPKVSEVWEILSQLTTHEKTTREDVEGLVRYIRTERESREKPEPKKEPETATELNDDDYYHIYG